MPVKIAVIGAGVYGNLHLKVYKQMEQEGKVRLVCFSARSQKTVDKHQEAFGIKGYTDFQEMLKKENLDAVSIATPDFLHREMAVESAKSGKHVLVEKPMDTTIIGCQEMIETAFANGVLLQVDFHKRFDPYLREIKRMVGENQLGQIQYGYAHMEDLITMPTEWILHWAEKTSPAWLLGIHMYDIIRWIMGSEVRRVYATGVKRALKSHGIDALDSVQAKLEFENGASFTVDSSWMLPESFEAVVDQSIRIAGDRGILEADLQDRGIKACIGKDGMKTYNTDFLRIDKNKQGRTVQRGYGVESIVDFIDNVNYILDGGRVEEIDGKYPSGKDGLEATKIAVAVHKSIEGGRIVEIEK